MQGASDLATGSSSAPYLQPAAPHHRCAPAAVRRPPVTDLRRACLPRPGTIRRSRAARREMQDCLRPTTLTSGSSAPYLQPAAPRHRRAPAAVRRPPVTDLRRACLPRPGTIRRSRTPRGEMQDCLRPTTLTNVSSTPHLQQAPPRH